jgi:hypothetical protein
MSRKEVLTSFRKLLRSGSKCKDYNYRYFLLRRISEEFRANQNAAADAVSGMLENASTQLENVERIVTVQNLYASPNSVMDYKSGKY